MNISIKPITKDDLDDVVALVHEFAAFENLSEYCEITSTRLDAAMFADGHFLEGLIARDGDAAVAYALFFPNFSSFRGARGFHLDDIYITAAYRKKGFGERMLSEIAHIAASRGFERIDFMVLDWNTPAIDFYFRLGAERNDEERHFKFDGEAFQKLAKG